MTENHIIDTEVAVIGAGPGGYAAAFACADRGMEVTLIDARDRLGGVCLHVGCIPSKALLHAASVIEESRLASEWGLEFGEPRIDLDKLRGWKQGVVDKLVGGLGQLAKSRKVKHLQGTAVFVDSERLNVEMANETRMVRFKKAILATGSSPVIPPALRIDSDRVMDSTGALALKDVPETLLVVGGGYIGLELATVYAALGSKITVVEMTDGLLPGVDRDLLRPLQAKLKKSLAAIHLNTKVAGLEKKKNGVIAKLEGENVPESQTFDRVLIAVGRRPNSEGIGLENTKATRDRRGFVVVDPQRRTADPNVYAIGDVAGEPMLAHKAHREAIVAAEAIAGEPAAFDPLAIPAVVFSDPEIAWCGLTETQAKEQGIEIESTRFLWGAASRALTLGRSDGATKIVSEPGGGRILGVGIVGPRAGDLISEAVLAIEMGATVEDMASVIHPHPTLSETLMEAADAVLGHATHLYKPKKN